MLDSIHHLGENEIAQIIDDVRTLVGCSETSNIAPEDLVEEISNVIGDDLDGPALWGNDDRVQDLRDVISKFDAQSISSEKALEDIARICA